MNLKRKLKSSILFLYGGTFIGFDGTRKLCIAAAMYMFQCSAWKHKYAKKGSLEWFQIWYVPFRVQELSRVLLEICRMSIFLHRKLM